MTDEPSSVQAGGDFTPVALMAAFVVSPAGSGAPAHYSACALMEGSAKPDPALTAMSPVHHKPMPVLTMRSHLRPRDPARRIPLLLESVLLDAAASLPRESEWERVLLYIVLPPEQTARGKRVQPEAIQAHFASLDPVFVHAGFRVVRAHGPITGHLAEAAALTRSGAHPFVLFAVADTLVDPFSCAELEKRVPLQTAREPQGTSGGGVIPSEAACALVLASREAAAEPGAALGMLSGLGVAEEPHPLEPDLHSMTGLPQAVATALAAAKLAPQAISGALLPIGTELFGQLEWNQTAQRLWPLRISEQQRTAVELGEVEQPEIPPDPRPQTLFAAIALGETGIAALPVLIGTAGAWLAAPDETAPGEGIKPRRLLVTETGITSHRGAVVLEALPASQGRQ